MEFITIISSMLMSRYWKPDEGKLFWIHVR